MSQATEGGEMVIDKDAWCEICGQLECEDPEACTTELAARTAVRRLFTFGFGQTDPDTGRSLANRYVWVGGRTFEECRERMLDRFGRAEHGGNWAFDYESAEAAGVDRHGMIEIVFDTGLDVGEEPPTPEESPTPAKSTRERYEAWAKQRRALSADETDGYFPHRDDDEGVVLAHTLAEEADTARLLADALVVKDWPEHLTCDEADNLAALLRAVNADDKADELLFQHSYADKREENVRYPHLDRHWELQVRPESTGRLDAEAARRLARDLLT